MQKMKKFISKNWLILVLILITILRIVLTFNLPSFYINNLRYDDKLMISQLSAMERGKYLGKYNDVTMVKGIAYPIFLYLIRLTNMSYGFIITIIYISACIFFVNALRKIIKDKSVLAIIYIFLLFNPLSYSSDLFQRLYRNGLTIIELLYFLGIIINIITSKKNSVINYIFLGLIMSFMLLTREDNIWIIIVFAVLVIYKLYKEFKIKNVLKLSSAVLVAFIGLNIVSYINYKNYDIYTYNELTDSNFKDAYIKILQIKDEKKENQVSITKETLYKLSEKSEMFNLRKEFINDKYLKLAGENGEIYNGNIVWYIRAWIYQVNGFKNGKEANEYWGKLSNEIEELFQKGELEREFVIPSVKLNTPTIDEITELPKNFIDAIIYTTTYKNVKSFTKKDMEERSFAFDEKFKAYYTTYKDYHNAENIIDNNPIGFEMIRIVYMCFTVVFGIIALVIYVKNIKIKDKLNLLTHITLLVYLIILAGITYTHTTAFSSIRYCYLGNVYILQNLFILLNAARVYDKKRGNKNDISNNTSVQ